VELPIHLIIRGDDYAGQVKRVTKFWRKDLRRHGADGLPVGHVTGQEDDST
jgi:hypothetical protein